MVNITLQNRLILLTVVLALFFISVFAAIQLVNELHSITLFNTFRAKLGSTIARNAFEAAFAKIDINSPPAVNQASSSTISALIESGVVEKAELITKPSFDKTGLQCQTDKWFLSCIDKRAREANIFVRFLKDDPYLLKLSYQLGNVQDALNQVYKPITATFIIVAIAGIIFAMLMSKAVIFPIKALNRLTKEVASGNLDLQVQVKTNDELEELGSTFNYMTLALKKMKERAENANPLTKLPGNIVIMEDVEKRIRNKEMFSVVYSDLNNFKSYNDKYGIRQGDLAIMMTADIIKEALKEKGGMDDLLGHEGGDDFIVITSPEKADAIAKAIIEKFDEKVKSLYPKEDAAQGFFISVDRDNKPRKFPIMGIALAGVTNQHRGIKSYAEVTNICAEVKKKIKAIGKSAWWMDQRR